MLIGSQYSDNKLYRGIRHYDSLPLTSDDIHEYADTVHMKNAYIMNNILGYGILNTPTVIISREGIRLNEPAVVIIDGDIILVQSDNNNPLISKDSIQSAGYESGVLCIVGWYQALTTSSTLRNYGGVDNSVLPNDLLDERFNIQVSSRYQFRWAPILLNPSDVAADSLTFNLAARDETGEFLGGNYSVKSTSKFGNVFVANKPSAMSYALSDLYIVPLVNYTYSNSSDAILDASACLPVTPKGYFEFIKSETEPVGDHAEGTVWYNPITKEFKTYVVGVGFVGDKPTTLTLDSNGVLSI